MKETKSKYAVLGMLSICPMSGYDIKKRIEGSISNFWSESYGQIYPILKRLVSEQFVTKTVERQSGKPDRHVYALTERGRKELQRWLTEGIVPKVERNELLLRLFFGEEAAVTVSIEHVEKYKELQLQLLEKYSAIEKEIKATYVNDSNLPYWLMTLRYGQHVSQALFHWCDETLVTLNKIGNDRKKPQKLKAKALDRSHR
jgi:DNA-binding PadR family transcriptional regulator